MHLSTGLWISRKSIRLRILSYKMTCVISSTRKHVEMLLLKIQDTFHAKCAVYTGGIACLGFLCRNPGRTCWQVGKSLLDHISVDSSSKVEEKHTRGELVQARMMYHHLSSHPTR